MYNDIQQFYLGWDEPNRSCLLTMRDIVLDQDEHVTETQKYGMPCFCYKGKMFCYLWVEKKTNWPYLLMVEGKHLRHPQLVSGSRSRMKILRVDPNGDLPMTAIRAVLEEALDLYRQGKIQVKN